MLFKGPFGIRLNYKITKKYFENREEVKSLYYKKMFVGGMVA